MCKPNKGCFFKIILFRPKGVKEAAETNEKVTRKGTQKRYPEKVPRKSTQKLGATAQKILDMMATNPLKTISEISIEIDITPKAVKKHLANLKKKELIRRIGPDKGGHWEVINESKE